jgi:hypothetical protein
MREYRVNSDIKLEFNFYENDLQQIPTAATITIYNPAGTSLVSTTAAIATDGTISYSFSKTLNTNEGRNFRADLLYTIGGVQDGKSILFDVVKTPLINDVTDEDLFVYLPELRNKIKDTATQTTANGANNYLYAELLKNDGRQFAGGRVSIFFTTGRHDAKITAFNQAAGMITFSPAAPAVVSSGVSITLRPSFQKFINTAFENHVIREIRNSVRQFQGTASQYIDSSVVHNLTIYKTLEIYCAAQIEVQSDKWDIRKGEMLENYKAGMASLAEPYDKDQDGVISDDEDYQRPNRSDIKIIL